MKKRKRNDILITIAIMVLALLWFIFLNTDIKKPIKPLINDTCLSISNIAYTCYVDGFNKRKINYNTVPYNEFCRYFHVKGYIDGIGGLTLNKNDIILKVYQKCIDVQNNELKQENAYYE